VEHSPANPAYGDAYRGRLTGAISAAAEKHNLPPLLIVAVVYRESSFKTEAKGFAKGEMGLMQVHGRAAAGCELETVEGQIDCGASWLNQCREKCTTVSGALTAYATGRCKAKTKRVERLVKSRIRLWKKLEGETNDE
jgi:membrane-bound lytic murein transglycosylase MltF